MSEPIYHQTKGPCGLPGYTLDCPIDIYTPLPPFLIGISISASYALDLFGDTSHTRPVKWGGGKVRSESTSVSVGIKFTMSCVRDKLEMEERLR
jgi:hypothetical protein